MACRGNLAHDLRTLARYPAEHEEGSPNRAPCEHFKERPCALAHARAKRVPRPAVNDLRESLDLEIVLDVDRECVLHLP